MAALEFFTVTADLSAVTEGAADPSEQPVTGFVDFFPRLADGAVIWAPDLDSPRGLLLRPVRGRFVDDGTLHRIVGTNEVQTVTISGSPTGGTFTLTFAGDTTAAIAYDATAAQVQAALQALASIGADNVTVAGNAGGPYTVTFTGDLAALDVETLTADGSALSGGTTPAVAVATTTAGAAGASGVKLVAPTASLPISSLIYDVVPSQITIGPAAVNLAPFAFSAPTQAGVTVDLSSVSRIDALPGLKPLSA